MSLAAMVWAFQQQITPSSIKFVLVALSDCANPQDGRIFPSIEGVCEKTSQNRKTVIEAIDALEGMGFLIDTGERIGRTKQVKVYKLNGFETSDDRLYHYVYSLSHDSGEFYIGVRTSIYRPEEDICYMGSGVWPNAMRKAKQKLKKEIVQTFESRAEADVAEKNLIATSLKDTRCRNRLSIYRGIKIEQYQNSHRSERVPNSSLKSPKFLSKESQIWDTEPNEQNITQAKDSCESGFNFFWDNFPRQRRGNKDKALTAYKKALKRATKEEINGGLRNYIGSDEVARGFAKGAAAWLNDDRWTSHYCEAGKTTGGKSTYADSLENASRNATNFLREKEDIRAQGS